jgi:hypothetical protein
VTEELALEQPVGHRAAIQLDEGAALSGAVVVDCAGHEFLARAAFSGDEHRSIRGCDELNLLHHFPQAGTIADDIAEVVLAADFLLQVGVLRLEPDLFALHQHPIRNIDEHRPRVFAAGSGLGPPLDPHGLAVVLTLKFEHHATGLGPTSNALEHLAQAALGLGCLRHERLAEGSGDLFGLDAHDAHRGAIGLDEAGVNFLMHVSDRSFVKKIPEALLTLP